MNATFQLVCVIASAVVMYRAVMNVNRMCGNTSHIVRLAYALIAVGSFGEMAAVFQGHEPGVFEAIFIAGFAVLEAIDRRCVTHWHKESSADGHA